MEECDYGFMRGLVGRFTDAAAKSTATCCDSFRPLAKKHGHATLMGTLNTKPGRTFKFSTLPLSVPAFS